MAFPNSPNDLDTTIVNGITYEYSAAKTAWIRRKVGVSDITFAGNVTANKVLTTDIRWAGNNAIFNAGITYTASTTPVAAKVGDQWYNTATDVLYEYVNDGTTSYWVDIQSLGTSTGNAVAKSLDDITLSGNLLLTANLLYSVGGDTGRLRHIYAGNVTSVTGNINTVNAVNITGANITLTANVVAANVRSTGNVVGTYFLGNGAQLSGITAASVGAASTGKAIAMAIVFGG